eukprot:symbB.v1.2.012780.t2/scaffold859.1/size157342/5
MVKLEDDLAKLVTEREKLMAMKRKAELTFEKQQTVETFRPTWCGPKVETLPYCEEKLNGLDDRIISLRQEHDKERSKDPTARTSHCGFVTFRGRRFAEMAQNLQISADKREWKVSAAPEVNDLRWADLQKPRTKKIASEALGFICCIGLYLAFMPLVGFITNLGKVVNVGPLQPIWDGFAPTLGLTVCLCFLPTVFMTIFNTFFVLKSDSFAQHKLQFWFFLFQLIFVVLVTTLGKSILTRFPEIAQNPQDMLEIMADSLPNASHYYMTYLVLQWSRRAMEMLRYMPLSKFLLFRAIFSPEEAKEMAEPEDQDSFGFGARNVNLAVSVVLGLVFCSMSPIVTLLAMCDLILARMTYGYLTIFAETKKPDLGGVFWVTQIQFIQVAMALYCLFMVGVLRQKSSSYAWVVAAPSLLIVLFSFWHIPRAYQWRKLPFQEVAFGIDKLEQQDSDDLNLGLDLSDVSAREFRTRMFDAVEEHLCARPNGTQDHSEWLRTAVELIAGVERTGLSNRRSPEFVALHIPPRTAFFVHQHPGIELVFLIRGSLWEIRLEEPAHLNRECQEVSAPYGLKDPQCLMIAIWPGRYVVFSEDQLPDGVFKPVPMAATGGQMGSGHAGWLSVCA